MNVTQEKPYLPFALALIFGALPLALVLFEVVQVVVNHHTGLFLRFDNGSYGLSGSWRDSVIWFVFFVFWLVNLALSAALTELAHKKMMRRRFRYALFLAGVAAGLAALVVFLIGIVLGGDAAFGGLKEKGILYYTVSVFVLANLFLPKQLTRAPEQTITFHKMPRK